MSKQVDAQTSENQQDQDQSDETILIEIDRKQSIQNKT